MNSTAAVWLAFTVFSDPDACMEHVQKHGLMQQLDWQCVLIEPEEPATLPAPATSLRPKARP